ncbi:MAG: efflux RND transporter periplasmic adaptor subunit [Sandaracinaceae bacterium]|nr:efflux RND transporter periplasmic adaptor subunit [Sandaracinaceae bacterium]
MRRSLLLGLALALASCGTDAEPHTVHDHLHEDSQGHHDHEHGGVVGVTRWTDRYELFAEHPMAVAGQPVPFTAHLTTLDGFRPLEGATVRLTLAGPTTVSADGAMLRSGIYQPTVTPTSAGTYQGRLEVIAGGEGVVDGFEVVVYATEAEAEAAAPEEAHGRIALLKEQQWRVPFATAFVEAGTVAPGHEVAGELGAPPSGNAHVHAPVAGRVMAGRAGFPLPGQRIEAGQELATLAPTPGSPEDASRAESQVVDAEVQLEEARAALERAERLLADHAVPERQVAEAQRRVRSAEAGLAASRRAQALYASASRGSGRGTWRITSPIAGVLDEVRVSPGEAVEANELLFRVIDPSERWLTAFVPESWASRIRPERGVTFRLLGEDRARPVDGALVNVSSAIDELTRTVRVIWSLPAPAPELRVGAAVRVSIPSGDAEEGVVVPASALVAVQGRQVVYVQVTGEAFVERAVRVGPSDGARVLVREGLAAGERVVTTGGYLVRLASTAGAVQGHGHPH